VWNSDHEPLSLFSLIVESRPSEVKDFLITGKS